MVEIEFRNDRRTRTAATNESAPALGHEFGRGSSTAPSLWPYNVALATIPSFFRWLLSVCIYHARPCLRQARGTTKNNTNEHIPWLYRARRMIRKLTSGRSFHRHLYYPGILYRQTTRNIYLLFVVLTDCAYFLPGIFPDHGVVACYIELYRSFGAVPKNKIELLCKTYCSTTVVSTEYDSGRYHSTLVLFFSWIEEGQ